MAVVTHLLKVYILYPTCSIHIEICSMICKITINYIYWVYHHGACAQWRPHRTNYLDDNQHILDPYRTSVGCILLTWGRYYHTNADQYKGHHSAYAIDMNKDYFDGDILQNIYITQTTLHWFPLICELISTVLSSIKLLTFERNSGLFIIKVCVCMTLTGPDHFTHTSYHAILWIICAYKYG